jgi:hypothetical protein
MGKWVIAAVCLSLWSSAAQALCRMGAWQSVHGVLTQAQMHTSSGRVCTTGQGFRISSRNTFHGIKITTQPRNGEARASGHHVKYRSRPGYRGQDTFVFTVYGTQSGAPRVAPVQVNVVVE